MDAERGEISLKELARVLLKRKRIIIASVIIFSLIAVLTAFLSPPLYKSSSVLLVRTNRESGSSQLASMAALVGLPFGAHGDKKPEAYLPEVIRDRRFVTRLVTRPFQYGQRTVNLLSLWYPHSDSAGPDSVTKDTLVQKAVGRFRAGNHLSISEDKRTGLLDMVTGFEDPLLAVSVNRCCIELIDDYMKTNRRSQARENRLFIERRLAEVEDELANHERAFAAFCERNTGSNAPRVLTERQRLLRLVTLTQEVFLQLRKQYELARIEEARDQPIVEIIRQPELPRSRSQPRRKLIVILGSFLGLISGVCIVLILEALNTDSKHERNQMGHKENA